MSCIFNAVLITQVIIQCLLVWFHIVLDRLYGFLSGKLFLDGYETELAETKQVEQQVAM